MNDLLLSRLSAADAAILSSLLATDENEYQQYFIPFATDIKSLEERLGSTREDRYWGIWLEAVMIGFFMLRGFDEGYKRPSFGVYVACEYSCKGLSQFALDYCISWCRLNKIEAIMLKVHPDNLHARHTYEKAGFTVQGTCAQTGHIVMEKRWSKQK